MGSTKTLVTCFLVIILAVSLPNNNVLASDARIEGFSFDNCNIRCSEDYWNDECNKDCLRAGFQKGGQCGSPCIPCPVKCCCQK
ncbi:Defensin-like protein 47 [Arabidopsis thaliana]|uniref:Defensin-like protein 47 n=4 Tax=Arabidopsis TaxID=3701 RepID=DEF47_ARATH|nr:Cysteine-rich protein [Arabidopsis thaliana]Q3E7C7.1 RecName: Full=Defensin-like protein 47; Flags: Precursor [Arabidopsis thaliana]KAG7625521.1 hypothetical protein ISN45_At03g017490 [Arabidopsis thaliana x Arabidopsis arenosa]KAG7631532.1 hypothetical protein ISN44_As03g017470 [Arabidopsis suecica]AEE75881.1 Cysteine-rich protein [Arabidopsis thaliana]OAP01840.1 hypothetical protein AXX17_AT3G17780 [Arabidopsis thaliana]CAA0382688.1 unnamed protein product [Arabidopsis thaliana]|eukprot:NP_974325.1 Cysteine-rich protein [Arabidopsis thaliana]